MPTSLIDQYRQALSDCRALYVEGARQCARDCPSLLPGLPIKFVELMDDLHRGLLAKIFVTVSTADRQWTLAEDQYASVLFEHVWQRHLTGKPLRDAMLYITKQTAKLEWNVLLRPFEQLAPLRDRASDLYTIVMRIAQILAKADGQMVPAETAALVDIRSQLLNIQGNQRHGLRLDPVVEVPTDTTNRPSGQSAQAVDTLSSNAQQVRDKCNLTEAIACQELEVVPEETLEDVLSELDQLIGIRSIKNEIRTLANFLKIQTHRQQAGLPATTLSLHSVFSGNPGTGKTTVARIVGRLFKALNVLEKGHVVEIDRSGLVAEYAGQTAVKANNKIDEALDGILFIDEAYSLVAESGDDPYGNEAVQVLLKRMEDDRQRLVVILAGYPGPMGELLNSNPGLSSRFNHHITFPDYSASELGQIFDIFCTKNRYEIPATVRAKLLLGFRWWFNHRDERFGNGRMVRNVFELAIRRLANRIINVVPLTQEVLTVFHPDDIDIDKVPADIWADIENENRMFRVTCEGCGTPSEMPQKFLGQRMKCKKCELQFIAGWGEPIC